MSRLVPWLVAVALGSASPATAQDDEAARRATARALFDEGIAAADAGRWPDAADRFGRALELRWSPIIAFNLATALEHVGRLVEASETLRRIGLDASAGADVRSEAAALLASLSPRLGRLVVRASGALDGVEIRLDGRTVLTEVMLGVAMPADPGSHEATAARAGETVASGSAEVASGGSAEIALTVPEAPRVADPAGVAAGAGASTEARTTSLLDGARGERPVEDTGVGGGWIAAGILGGVAVIATIVAVVVLTSQDDGAAPMPYCGSLGCAVWD